MGSFLSFQIQKKEGDSIFGSEYVSHGERDPDQTILLSSHLYRTIKKTKLKPHFMEVFQSICLFPWRVFSTVAPALTQTH